MPVRNEEWILEKTLTDLSTYVDEIVVVDDGSTDNTPEILRSFNKVTAIHTNPSGTLPFNNGQESSNRNKVLDMARERGAEWILQIDADEIFEDRIKDELPKLLEQGCSVKFQICHLWGGLDNFRVDDEWGQFYRFRLFQLHGSYARRMRFSEKHIIATPRAYDRKNIHVSGVKLIHYGWIDSSIRDRSLRRYFEVYKLKYPQKEVGYDEFINSEEMLTDLKIVRQDSEDMELLPWEEMMGDTSKEKFEL